MQYIANVEGMHCGHCEASVETALLNVDGVTHAEADHETGVVEIACAENVSSEAIAEAVRSAGFTPASVEARA